jgi:hypothetical protein
MKCSNINEQRGVKMMSICKRHTRQTKVHNKTKESLKQEQDGEQPSTLVATLPPVPAAGSKRRKKKTPVKCLFLLVFGTAFASALPIENLEYTY